jgi:putative transposase
VPQSLANVLVHIVFSTKRREPCISNEIESELYPYLASVCQAVDSPAHIIGGTENHIHLAITLGRTTSLAKLLEELKKNSSKWIKTKGSRYASFAWQNGYGAFSIGQSQLASLKRYIVGQKEHHRTRTFEEELREILKRYQVHYDERYVWD